MNRMYLSFTTGMVIWSVSTALYAGTQADNHLQNSATASTNSIFPTSPLLTLSAKSLRTVAAAPRPIVNTSHISVQTSLSQHFSEPSASMEFLQVPGGCFQMGSSSDDADEKPVHQVCLDSFFVGTYEVTQGQWQQIMGNNPSFFSSCGNDCPVENVSWNDVQKFTSKLSRLDKTDFRLLTEAEWEYTCRSAGKSEHFCGGTGVDPTAWYDRNSSSTPHPVGEKRPNGLGIYDMSGNVWEWVSDWYDEGYYGISADSHNPAGPLNGSKRVIRGGSWYNDAKNVRASMRSSDDPEHRSINVGFRLAYSAR